jgi:hypothetical protein
MIYAADGMMTPRNIFLSGYGSTTNQILHGKRILILAGCIPIYKTVLPMFGSFYQPPTTNHRRILVLIAISGLCVSHYGTQNDAK